MHQINDKVLTTFINVFLAATVLSSIYVLMNQEWQSLKVCIFTLILSLGGSYYKTKRR